MHVHSSFCAGGVTLAVGRVAQAAILKLLRKSKLSQKIHNKNLESIARPIDSHFKVALDIFFAAEALDEVVGL